MLKLNPGQPTMWLSPRALQVGLDTKAVIVDGLSPAHQRFIRSLQAGIADNQVQAAARLAKLSESAAEDLLTRLRPQLLNNEAIAESAEPGGFAQRRLNAATSLFQGEPDFAELIAFALATNKDSTEAFALRKARVVKIEYLDRTGVTLVRALATAGFAQFWSDDRAKVAECDISALGYSKDQLGRPRFEALCEIAGGFKERLAMVDSSGLRRRTLDRIDMAVLIGGQSISPARQRNLRRHGVPHIAIQFRSDGALVSPIIVPNKGHCLNCVEQQLWAADPNSGVKILQLQQSKTAYDDSSSVLFAASMATASIASYLDSIQGFEHSRFEGTGWRFERATGALMRLEWPETKPCDCDATDQIDEMKREAEDGRPNESDAA